MLLLGYEMLRLAVLAIACVPLAIAQSTTTTTTAQTSGRSDLIDKLLGMVGPASPKQLTEKERFQRYLLDTAGPVPLIGEAAAAGIAQWANRPHEWGQGWNAYGRRYGAFLAYNGVRQTISYGTAVIFHEDARYFASGKSGVWPRTKHALVSTFTARHPDGRTTFSISSVAGVIGAASIQSVWGPPSWQGAGNIAETAGISFATTAGFNVVREFLSDILHRPRK
jgi:hypothetical protein